MAATFTWAQSNGVSSAQVVTDLGISGNLFNFKKNDSATAADYSSNPVTAGNKSMEVWNVKLAIEYILLSNLFMIVF